MTGCSSLSFRSFRSQFYIPVPCKGLPLPQTLSCPTCNEQNFRLCRIVNPNTSILYQVRRSLRTRHRGGEKLERLLLAMTNPAAFADSAEPAGHVNQSFYKSEANLKFAKNLSFSFLSDIITEKKTTRTKIMHLIFGLSRSLVRDGANKKWHLIRTLRIVEKYWTLHTN